MALLELDTYTGQLNYKDILFTFVLTVLNYALYLPPINLLKSSLIGF